MSGRLLVPHIVTESTAEIRPQTPCWAAVKDPELRPRDMHIYIYRFMHIKS